MKIFKQLTIILCLFCAFNANTVFAIDNMRHERAGVIDQIRFEENVIIVSDKFYYIIPQVLVNQDGRVKLGVNHLSKGLPIGYKVDATGKQPIITEVWVLDSIPSGPFLD